MTLSLIGGSVEAVPLIGHQDLQTSPLLIFLWSWMKSKVYRREVNTRELLEHIMNVIARKKGTSRCTQTSNTLCPHMSCKAHWSWRWNFRKCIMLGKPYKLCHLNNKYRYYNISFLPTIFELYSEITLYRKPFGIGHKITFTVCTQNIDHSPGTLCIYIHI
jgi:hypothetical protein